MLPTPAASRRHQDLDDCALVRLCLERDEEAWRSLLDRYARLIYSIPIRRGLGQDLADEVFQSVAATLVERLPYIQDPTCLPKWLVVTTLRRSRLVAARAAQSEGLAAAENEPSADGDIEGDLAREEIRAHVASALQELPARDRELLLDLFDRELPYAEVAQRHGLRIGSLGSLRARALARLRRILDARGVL